LYKKDFLTKKLWTPWNKNFKRGPYNLIGKNISIGSYCIIEDGVIIGDNVQIGNYVFLKKGTIIESNVVIDSYVRSSGDNYIGKNTVIRYGVTIAKEVEIGESVFISPNVMTIYSTHKGVFIKKTIIKDRVFIGTAAVIGAGVVLEKDIVIGAMSYVVKDCKKVGKYVGVPARIIEN